MRPRHYSLIRAVTCVSLFGSPVIAQEAKSPNLQRFYEQLTHPGKVPTHEVYDPKGSQLIPFNREKPKSGGNREDPNSGGFDLKVTQAITNSSTILNGTVIKLEKVAGCWTDDWTTTVLAAESSNVILYRPGDASVFCDPASGKTDLNDPNQIADLYIVVPVKAIWAEVSGFRGDLNDPARKTPGSLSPPSPCWTGLPDNPKPKPLDQTAITPCDYNLNEPLLRIAYYKSGWLYNRVTAPGVWAGSFSIAPQVVQTASQTISEDIRFYGSSKAGPGWLGLNAVFEKSASPASNLNSLSGALTYDVHLWNAPWWGFVGENQGFGVRPGEFFIASGEEYAPTRAKGANGFHEPKDLNLVEGLYYKQPFSVTAFKYPSFLTFFPIGGFEGGWHLIRDFTPGDPVEGDRFFRKVVGLDASIRYPFQKAPNFTSTKGATIDYTLRERFLSGNEPYLDAAHVASTPAAPELSRRRRSYSRIALTWPLSNYVAINIAAQRGSLPPDFASVPWALTLGLAFGSTGTVEH